MSGMVSVGSIWSWEVFKLSESRQFLFCRLCFRNRLASLQVSKQGSLMPQKQWKVDYLTSFSARSIFKFACFSEAKCLACNHTICFALLGICRLLSRSSVMRDLCGWTTADGEMENITGWCGSEAHCCGCWSRFQLWLAQQTKTKIFF